MALDIYVYFRCGLTDYSSVRAIVNANFFDCNVGLGLRTGTLAPGCIHKEFFWAVAKVTPSGLSFTDHSRKLMICRKLSGRDDLVINPALVLCKLLLSSLLRRISKYR